jgi:hypothetical protein
MRKRLLVGLLAVLLLALGVVLAKRSWREVSVVADPGDRFSDDKLHDHWVRMLEDQDPRVRAHAASVLAEIGPRPSAIPGLVQVLGDPATTIPGPWGVRGPENSGQCRAAEARAKMGEPAVPALTEALKGRTPSGRLYTALALWKIRHDPKQVGPVLAEVINHLPGEMYFEARHVQEEMGERGRELMPEVKWLPEWAEWQQMHWQRLKERGALGVQKSPKAPE